MEKERNARIKLGLMIDHLIAEQREQVSIKVKQRQETSIDQLTFTH